MKSFVKSLFFFFLNFFFGNIGVIMNFTFPKTPPTIDDQTFIL